MCDCLAALPPATESGRALFAKNSDRPPDEPQRIEWLAPRRDDGPVATTYIEVAPHGGDTVGALVSRPAWMWGVEHGVNAAGVAIGNATIYTTLDPRQAPAALTGMDLVRLGLERGTSAAESVAVIIDLLERYGQGGSGHQHAEHPYWSSFLVADCAEGWVVETSGRTWATEQVGRTRAISNRTTIFEFDVAHRHPRQPVETLVDPRLAASQRALTAEPIGGPDLKQHLRSHVGEQGYSVCMHAEDQATTASLVVELPSDGASPCTHVSLGSPCTSVFVPLFVGRDIGTPLPWERFAALRPSQRRTLDELERGLVADATDDDAWASEAWRRVDAVLPPMA
jgi:secernin